MNLKKALFTMLLFVLFVPFVLAKDTCDTDSVTIESVEVIESTETIPEVGDPSINGNIINVDMKLSNPGEKIGYLVVIKNESDDDFELEDIGETSSTYIDFSIEPKDGSNTIKANSKKELTLSVEYKSAIPENMFQNGKYVNTPNIVLVKHKENPKTLTGIMVGVAFLLFVISLIVILVSKKRMAKILVPVFLAVAIIPLTVYAICEFELKVVPNITILKNYNPCTFDGELVQGALYTNGQYTYKYKQKAGFTSVPEYWENIDEDGWGVALTDRESTDPVTTKLCTSINGKPIVSFNGMFANVHARSIDLTSFDTSNVTDMSVMFMYGFSDYTLDLDFSSFDTSKVKNMYGMFYENNNIKELDLSMFDTSNVESMASVFMIAHNLTKLNISGWNTSKVTDMSYMFAGAEKLKNIDVRHFDTSKVTDMGNMFAGTAIESIDLSNFDTSKVTKIDSMFSDCANLKTLDITNFDTSKVEYMSGLLDGTTSLKSIDLSHLKTSNVVDMSNMFRRSGLESLNMSRFDTSKVTGMSGMFADMPNITTINVSNFDTSKVKNMSSMFSGLSKVTTLNLSNFNTSQVTDMRYMFMDSARLSNINLTSFDTSSLKVGTYDDGAHSMFKGIPATLLYARTYADADRFNNSQNKPDTLTFVVQQ